MVSSTKSPSSLLSLAKILNTYLWLCLRTFYLILIILPMCVKWYLLGPPNSMRNLRRSLGMQTCGKFLQLGRKRKGCYVECLIILSRLVPSRKRCDRVEVGGGTSLFAPDRKKGKPYQNDIGRGTRVPIPGKAFLLNHRQVWHDQSNAAGKANSTTDDKEKLRTNKKNLLAKKMSIAIIRNLLQISVARFHHLRTSEHILKGRSHYLEINFYWLLLSFVTRLIRHHDAWRLYILCRIRIT